MLPRFGIRLFLNKSFDSAEYYGYGPYESYADKHRASYMGLFEDKISNMHEDYIRPQENSSHWGCKYASVTDGNTVIRFESDGDFSFNASEYTPKRSSPESATTLELENARATSSALTARCWRRLKLLWSRAQG